MLLCSVPAVLLRLSLLLGLLVSVGLPGRAQAPAPLTGVVLDADTRQPLPLVSLRLLRARRGATSRADGSFQLPPAAGPDTLVVSRIGYASLRLATAGLASPLRLGLRRQPVGLPGVAVRAGLAERRFGVTSAKALIHFTDGTQAAGETVEISQLIRLGTSAAVPVSAELNLAATTADSLNVELRCYGFDGQRPTRPLLPQPLRQRVAVRAGWLRLPLPPGLGPLPAEFVLGLTLRPDQPAHQPIPYEIKLGGPAKSFVRRPADSAWQVPPHHYRLRLTALVPAAPARPLLDDNQETTATTYRYARAVADSFALFVRQPAGYARHPRRRYPLVLLLDANAYFDQVADAVARLPAAEQPLLVGLGYRDVLHMDSLRQRDYLYPAADSVPLSGGGQRFRAFIGQELLPYLDEQYRIQPTGRTLMGHSFGGYFVLYALLADLGSPAPAFTHYVAASPSLWYADQYLPRELATAPPAGPGRTLRLSFGEPELRPTEAEGAATRAAFEELLRVLAARHPALLLTPTRYPSASHLETALPAFTAGLRAGVRSRQQ